MKLQDFFNQPANQWTAKAIVNVAETNAEQFRKDRLKTNQIRNIYSAVNMLKLDLSKLLSKKGKISDEDFTKEFDTKIMTKIILLKPKLAYAAGRQRSVRQNFYPFMTGAIESVKSASDEGKVKAIQNFFLLVESVVGFHKFYGD